MSTQEITNEQHSAKEARQKWLITTACVAFAIGMSFASAVPAPTHIVEQLVLYKAVLTGQFALGIFGLLFWIDLQIRRYIKD